jgi:N-acetylmuramoyl-L-alanine amidase
MKPFLLLFDPAHGDNIPGKRSPDGKLLEYVWSRKMILGLMMEFNARIHALDPGVKNWDIAAPLNAEKREPGLISRVNFYNRMAASRKHTVLLSIHVNAEQLPVGKWGKATGFEWWTRTIEDPADEYAGILAAAYEKEFPEELFRLGYTVQYGKELAEGIRTDADREKDFTIIAGYKGQLGWIIPKYYGVLQESMFMTNKQDVAKLLDEEWQRRWRKAMISAINKIFAYVEERDL